MSERPTSEREDYTCECVNGKDARGKFVIIRTNCVVDMEVQYEAEIRWVVVFALKGLTLLRLGPMS